MSQKFANVARSRLIADITNSATSLTVDAALADLFPVADTGTSPVPTAGKDYFKIVVQDVATAAIEIIYVRTRALGSPVLSNLLRGQEGTTALAFTAGTLSAPLAIVALRHTAQDLAGAIDLAGSATVQGKNILQLGTPFEVRQLLEITGDSYSLGGISVADFSMNSTTPLGLTEFMSTNPQGWNLGVGKLSVQYDFTSNSYFTYNPGSHFAVVLRQDPATAHTAPSGNGMIMGDLTWSGFAGDEALFEPTTMIETWDPARISTQRYIFPQTTGPRNKPLLDGVKYRVIIDSTVQYNGLRYARYRLYRYTGSSTNAWNEEVDTGDVLDHNPGADFTKTGVMFASVTPENLGAWSIDFTNVKITWGPAGDLATDSTGKLSKYGADLAGDLTFLDTARVIRHPQNTTGPSLANSLKFQPSTVNAGGGFVVMPNGTSTTSSILFSNNSLSTTTYQAMTTGMSGAKGVIETFGYAAANPTLDINIGVGNTVANFNTSGLTILGASSPIGPSIGISYTGLGGASATAFACGGSTLNFDANATLGGVSTFLGASYNQTLLEYTFIPLYAGLSVVMAALKARKIL